MTTNLSRRRFLGTSAAAAGTLVVGFHIPFAGDASAQRTSTAAPGAATPEINAWVVVKPDDTVVIRIARSEMGQGSLTGLAQLVAEELDCNWSKVTTEYPTPGENLARNRVWGNFSTGGSRGIRDSQEYVRKGGATARMMLVQAAADSWKVPAAECVAANSVITHTPSGRSTTYGKVAAAAAKVTPPTDVPLKNPKDWKVAGKRLARLDTADKVTGAQVYGMDLKLPGMLNAAIKDCPVFGGKVKSVDTAAVLKRPGVKKVVRVGDSAVAVVADTWWHAKTRARCAADRVGQRPECDGVERQVRRSDEGGTRRQGGGGRQSGRRCARGHRRGAAQDRGRLLLSAPESRDDGNDERDGALDARALRGLDADAEWRGRARRRVGGGRAAARQMRCLQVASGWRVRPPRRRARLGAPGGRDRQGHARHADQAHLVARGRHAARLLPPGHAMQADRRPRCPGERDRAAHADLGPVDQSPGSFRRTSRTARIRLCSRASTRLDRKPRSATRFRRC